MQLPYNWDKYEARIKYIIIIIYILVLFAYCYGHFFQYLFSIINIKIVMDISYFIMNKINYENY